MLRPNYDGGSILNLIASIEEVLGGKPKYKPLNDIDLSGIKNFKNIVFIVVDGLGYEFLMKHGKGTKFNENIIGKITSTFPTSTSAAMTGLMTGLSPQEHGMTGWYMFSKELGCQIIPLPYVPRFGGFDFGKILKINKMFRIPSFVDKLKIRTYMLLNEKIISSRFTKAVSGKAKRIGYKNMGDFFSKIKNITKSGNQRKFIFSYYNEFDGLCHDFGSESKKTLGHFNKLAKKLDDFLKSLKDTIVIITADHGIKELDKSKSINLKYHPKLKEALVMPLTGEGRFAYCYVKVGKEKEFETYVRSKLNRYCDLFRSEDLLKRGYFGKFEVHKDFLDRIGDYTIIMKENYSIGDSLLFRKKISFNIGDHGGLSKEELYVPVIVIIK